MCGNLVLFQSVANRIEWEIQGNKSGVTQPKGHGWVDGTSHSLLKYQQKMRDGKKNMFGFVTPWSRGVVAPRGWACTGGVPCLVGGGQVHRTGGHLHGR